jgi:hypothetical protein
VSADQPKNEEERIKYAFLSSFGALIWARAEMAKSHGFSLRGSDLSDLNYDQLHRFFTAGWRWGKVERPALCPVCCSETVSGDFDNDNR